MSIAGIVVVFFISWFLFLFVVLPFGVRTQIEEGERHMGTDPGAPVQPFLLRKFLITGVIAAVITLIAGYIIENKLVTLDDAPSFLKVDQDAQTQAN